VEEVLELGGEKIAGDFEEFFQVGVVRQ